MCLMLCVSPGEGQSIQYYQIKKNTSFKEYTLPVCCHFSSSGRSSKCHPNHILLVSVWVSFDLFPQSNDIHVNSAGDYKWPWMCGR